MTEQQTVRRSSFNIWWHNLPAWRRNLFAILGLAVFIGAFLAYRFTTDPSHDVTVSSCTAQDTGAGEAVLSVTNGGSADATYVITVTFTSSSGGAQYGTAVATVPGLGGGQTRTVTADGSRPLPGDFTCRVASVSHY